MQNIKQFFKTDKEEYVYPTHFFKPLTAARTIADAIIWVGVFISFVLYFLIYKRGAFTNASMALGVVFTRLSFYVFSSECICCTYQ
jgi:hypothetical protein